MAATPLDVIDNQRSELQAAFRAFGSVSEQLAGAFEALRGQVAQLHIELGEARAGKEHLAARLSALIEGLPGGVLVLDARGDIKESNPAALALLGEPLLGQTVQRRARARRRAKRRHRRANGAAQRPLRERLETRACPRRELDESGEVVLLADVTESHLMNVFLTRQQRLVTLGELAAGLAHQIRTPLAAALLYASQMTLPGRAAEDLSRCSEKTVASLKQLDRLVNDMLAFAHGGAAREPVSVSALLEQVAQWLRPALRSGVRLTIRTEAPGLTVRASAPSLVSAVLNLATNALQASAGGSASRAPRPPHSRRAAPRSW